MIITLTTLNISNGLVHLSIWAKPFITLRENIKISTDQVENSADNDHGETAHWSALITWAYSVATGSLRNTQVCNLLLLFFSS
jgi:hypothetical protein